MAGNKRALTKTLKAYHGDSTGARILAAHFAHAGSVPKKLREPLRALALTCLVCETAEYAPAGTPSFPELYRQREAAFTVFGDAVAAHFRKPHTRIEPPRDAEGIMYHDRTHEPEEP